MTGVDGGTFLPSSTSTPRSRKSLPRQVGGRSGERQEIYVIYWPETPGNLHTGEECKWVVFVISERYNVLDMIRDLYVSLCLVVGKGVSWVSVSVLFTSFLGLD